VGVCGVPKNAAQKLKSTVPCFRGRLFLACLLFQFGAHFLSTEIGVLIFLDLSTLSVLMSKEPTKKIY